MSDSDQSGEHGAGGEGEGEGVSRQDVSTGYSSWDHRPIVHISVIGPGPVRSGHHIEGAIRRISGFHDCRLARLLTIRNPD